MGGPKGHQIPPPGSPTHRCSANLLFLHFGPFTCTSHEAPQGQPHLPGPPARSFPPVSCAQSPWPVFWAGPQTGGRLLSLNLVSALSSNATSSRKPTLTLACSPRGPCSVFPEHSTSSSCHSTGVTALWLPGFRPSIWSGGSAGQGALVTCSSLYAMGLAHRRYLAPAHPYAKYSSPTSLKVWLLILLISG